MKHAYKIVILLYLVSNAVMANECNIRSASTLANSRSVGNITDLVQTITVNQCAVKFRITVDGVGVNAAATVKGTSDELALCKRAIEKARTDVLVNMGGKFETQSVTICQEGNARFTEQVKQGDTILETEVGRSAMKEYFTYNNARCRLFTERLNQNTVLRVNHGVICQIDNSSTNWLVVDKW